MPLEAAQDEVRAEVRDIDLRVSACDRVQVEEGDARRADEHLAVVEIPMNHRPGGRFARRDGPAQPSQSLLEAGREGGKDGAHQRDPRPHYGKIIVGQELPLDPRQGEGMEERQRGGDARDRLRAVSVAQQIGERPALDGLGQQEVQLRQLRVSPRRD